MLEAEPGNLSEIPVEPRGTCYVRIPGLVFDTFCKELPIYYEPDKLCSISPLCMGTDEFIISCYVIFITVA